MRPSRRAVGLLPQPAEGASSEVEFSPRRGPAEGSAEGVLSEAKIAPATRGLGREHSSEVEFALRLMRSRKSRSVGPWAERALWAFSIWRGFGHPSTGGGTVLGEFGPNVWLCRTVLRAFLVPD